LRHGAIAKLDKIGYNIQSKEQIRFHIVDMSDWVVGSLADASKSFEVYMIDHK
jgi:hypothetical protein